jgi:hypothetical protein
MKNKLSFFDISSLDILSRFFPPSLYSRLHPLNNFSLQVPNTLALFFVVAFGSCMDIAAIQAECPFEVSPPLYLSAPHSAAPHLFYHRHIYYQK